MIHQVLAAPKQVTTEDGLHFANKHQLGYEIPSFCDPAVLDDPKTMLRQWEKQLAGFQGMLALHGPVYDLNPVSMDAKIAEWSRKRYMQAFAVCQELGCRYMVVHSQYSPLYHVAKVKQEWFNATVDFWQHFAGDVLEEAPGQTIVIENFMEDSPEEFRYLIDKIDHPQVKACLDTGHANIFSRVPVLTWLDELEHQLVYVHAHNNFGKQDDHRGFRQGTLEMDGFLNHLIMVPYKINLALEVFHLDELAESYKQVRHYLDLQLEHLPEKSFLI